MTNLNANQLIIDAINRGQLSQGDAGSIIRGVGFQEEFGEGRATNFFNTNAEANQKALNVLQSQGLIPQESIGSFMSSTVRNPSLPSSSTFVPQVQQVQKGELLSPISIQAQEIGTQTPINNTAVNTNQASLDDLMVNYQDALNTISQGNGQYQANTIGNQTPQNTAAQGQVAELATVQGQLDRLYSNTESGTVPIWARGAVRKAEDVLASRGLGASSIAAGAITEAVQQSALNIAAQDAATYFQMDMTNLANEQQVRLENTRLKQQALLTDTASLNAAAQFNASSIQQVEQFQASLIASIKQQNANRVAEMRTFNTAEVNKVNALNANNDLRVQEFNAQQAMAVDNFNAQAKFQAEQFNANMASVIDQSNVAWRRQLNTANTASINAANQLNVQNAFNLSNYALNSLWQKSRDEANWLWQSAENKLSYDRSLGQISANRDANQYLRESQNDFDMVNKLFEVVGAVGSDVISNIEF